MAKIDIVLHNKIKEKAFSKAFFRRLVMRSLIKIKSKITRVEIGIVLVGEYRMSSLNNLYRKKDTPTDVLSFPLAHERTGGYNKHVLGDVVLCVPYIRRQAECVGIPLRVYMEWSFVHGFLHLCGYHHEYSEHDAKKMFALEDTILNDERIGNFRSLLS